MADDSDDPPKRVLPTDAVLGALSYEAPRDRIERDPPVNVLGITATLFIGFAVGVAGVFFGALLILALFSDMIPGRHAVGGRFLAGAIGFAFFSLVVVAIWNISRKFREKKLREIGTWLVIGLLMGFGMACLIEGFCFVAFGVSG